MELGIEGTLDAGGRRELEAFARYCTARLDDELGASAWQVIVKVRPTGFTAVVRATRDGTTLALAAHGGDPVTAVWNALCRLEQPLRERVRPAA